MVPPCYRHRIFSFEVIPSKLNNITSQCVLSNFLSFSFLTFDVAIHLYFNLLLLFMLKLTLVCTSHCLSATSRSSQFFELLLLLCFRTYSHFYLLRRLKCLVKPRAISTGQLHTLLHFHLRPIYQVVFLGPYPLSR